MIKKERNYNLDLTRVVAILAVVMIHSCTELVSNFDAGSREFFWGNVADSIARFGVPLFVMVSGALMLDEHRSVRVLKKFAGILGLFVFWSALYTGIQYAMYFHQNGEKLQWMGLVMYFVMGPFHMWYLYMTMGLYAITPILRRFVKKKYRFPVLGLILLGLITQFIPPALHMLQFRWDGVGMLAEAMNKFHVSSLLCYPVYYMMGWYFVHVGVNKKWPLYILGFASLVVVMWYTRETGDYNAGYDNGNFFVCAYSSAVFLALNSKQPLNMGIRTKKILSELSGLCFGVYIIHPMILYILFDLLPYSGSPLAYILQYFLIMTVGSLCVCFLLSKIPVLKKIIRA